MTGMSFLHAASGRLFGRPAKGLRRWRPFLFLILLAVVALAAAALIFDLTPYGVGVSSDSILYLGGAENIRRGLGWSRLSGGGTIEAITHFPPLYSLLVAGYSGLRGDGLTGARELDAGLFAGLVLAVGLGVMAVGGGRTQALIVALVVAVSPILIPLYTWAVPEPLFLVLGFLALVGLTLGLRHDRAGWFFAAGSLAALAYLTRYIGIALIATGVVLVLARPGWDRRKKGSRLLFFLLPALIPVLLLSVRNFALAGTMTNRTVAWHPIGLTKWKSPLGLIWGWLLPYEFTYPALLVTLAVAGALLVVLGFFLLRRRAALADSVREWLRRPSLSGTALAYAVVYSVSVGFSLFFFDAATPVDDRIAAPVYLSVVLAAAGGAAVAFGNRTASIATRAEVVVFVALLWISYVQRSFDLRLELREDGQGFSSRGWHASATAKAAGRLPSETLLYTNNPEALYFLTGLGSFRLPAQTDSVTLRSNNVSAPLERIRARLMAEAGAVVMFGGAEAQREWGYLEPLLSTLVLAESTSDGRIYVAPGAGGSG